MSEQQDYVSKEVKLLIVRFKLEMSALIANMKKPEQAKEVRSALETSIKQTAKLRQAFDDKRDSNPTWVSIERLRQPTGRKPVKDGLTEEQRLLKEFGIDA